MFREQKLRRRLGLRHNLCSFPFPTHELHSSTMHAKHPAHPVAIVAPKPNSAFTGLSIFPATFKLGPQFPQPESGRKNCQTCVAARSPEKGKRVLVCDKIYSVLHCGYAPCKFYRSPTPSTIGKPTHGSRRGSR